MQVVFCVDLDFGSQKRFFREILCLPSCARLGQTCRYATVGAELPLFIGHVTDHGPLMNNSMSEGNSRRSLPV
jgi:hypothetical protein